MARRSVYVDGFSHENPIPAGCVVDGVLFTGTIHGGGRGDRPESFPGDFTEQCRRMFDHVDAIVTAADGSLADVAKVSVRLADTGNRGLLNDVWCAVFPDPADRPARQVTVGTTRPHILVQCEVVAVLRTPAGGADTHG
jgi:2-iminobutanoate/2-iminopropanoate deaminase